MRSEIIDAIGDKKIITFTYSGKHREVEPHCLGENASGNIILRGYQIDGGSISREPEGWKLFKVEGISSLEILDADFDVRKDYKRNDSAMSKIISQIW